MEDWQVRMMLEAKAISVRVEGMKAENAKALHNKDSPYYDRIHFDEAADKIDELAHKIGHG